MALSLTSVTLLIKARDWNVFKKESLSKSGFHLILTAVRRELLLPCFTDEGYREVKHSSHTHTAEAAEQDLEPGCSRPPCGLHHTVLPQTQLCGDRTLLVGVGQKL